MRKRIVAPLKEISRLVSTGTKACAIEIPPHKEYAILEINTIYRELSEFLRSLEESRVELIGRERDSAIARTTQMLAHDVRKPFSSVKMVLNAMAKAKTLADVNTMTAIAIPEINRSLENVNGLIQDVMEIGAHSAPVTETVDVSELLHQALADTFRVHSKVDVTVHAELSHRTQVNVDRAKILRVFSNIFGNALQAMSFRGNLSITTRSVPGSVPMVEFTLANDGPHIPAEALPRLFEAFFTSGKKGGTGLGLAIAHKVVTAHGGAISCRSEPGRGVAFVFTLPASASGGGTSARPLPSHSSEFLSSLLTP